MSDNIKAIRDRIPEFIRRKDLVSRTIDCVFLKLLEDKVYEEFEEYKESKNKEEIADVLEVIFRIIQMNGWVLDDILDTMEEKRNKYGGFEKNLTLNMTKSKGDK
jgi:predicted house-cleaning noncanonical NTP pyrophosphatase (MazG superfamily)